MSYDLFAVAMQCMSTVAVVRRETGALRPSRNLPVREVGAEIGRRFLPYL